MEVTYNPCINGVESTGKGLVGYRHKLWQGVTKRTILGVTGDVSDELDEVIEDSFTIALPIFQTSFEQASAALLGDTNRFQSDTLSVLINPKRTSMMAIIWSSRSLGIVNLATTCRLSVEIRFSRHSGIAEGDCNLSETFEWRVIS